MSSYNYKPIGFGLLLLVLMGCNFIVRHFAFFPDRDDVLPPDKLPAGVQEVFLTTQDGERLQCYWLAKPESERVLIYFHGNAGNIGHRIPDLRMLAGMNLNVLGVGYRGYGKSTGKPGEQGIYADGRAALNHVQDTLGFKPGHIILFGRSIGSTVAVVLANDLAAGALILVTPMTTGKAVGKFHGYGPIAYLAGNAFDNLSRIRHIKSPLLIVHGTRDDVIPFAMGEQLFAAAPEPKNLAPVKDAGHNDISLTTADAYWSAISRFVEETR